MRASSRGLFWGDIPAFTSKGWGNQGNFCSNTSSTSRDIPRNPGTLENATGALNFLETFRVAYCLQTRGRVRHNIGIMKQRCHDLQTSRLGSLLSRTLEVSQKRMYIGVSIISGTNTTICTAVVVVLEYLGSQYTQYHSAGWRCWFFTPFYLQSCIRPDAISRWIQQRNSAKFCTNLG
jgi:hypothetical protein